MIHHRYGEFAPDQSPERASIRIALMGVLAEEGLEGTTEERVAARADLEPEVFRKHFRDVRDCCVKVYLANIDEFDRIVFTAVEQTSGWRNRLRISAWEAITYIMRRPVEARFNLIQMLSVSELAQAFRDQYVERIIDLIDEGRQELDDPDSMTREVAAGIFGSIYEFLVKQFHDEADIGVLDGHIPEMMYIAVRPYVGHEVAREELTMPRPRLIGEEATEPAR